MLYDNLINIKLKILLTVSLTFFYSSVGVVGWLSGWMIRCLVGGGGDKRLDTLCGFKFDAIL